MTDSNRISIDGTNTPNAGAARVVIVGGGFGGLAAAKALRKASVQVILIDRENHHLFQPLLYQVATSVLAPSQISSPIRGRHGLLFVSTKVPQFHDI
jgi:NADH dehydrogenase